MTSPYDFTNSDNKHKSSAAENVLERPKIDETGCKFSHPFSSNFFTI